MIHHKLEVFLNGELSTIDVHIDDMEAALREVNPNQYYSLYPKIKMKDDGSMNINVRLKGWTGMKWTCSFHLNGEECLQKEGTFDHKGFVRFKETINLAGWQGNPLS